jgi:mono/diheme cytochrome c family protein
MIRDTMRRRAVVGSVAGVGLALAILVGAGLAVGQDKGALVETGQRLFMDQGCYGCHTIGKTGTQGIAPDLSHVGAKHDLGYLAKWLQDPGAQRPTAHMPKIEMAKAEADALAAYLSSLH